MSADQWQSGLSLAAYVDTMSDTYSAFMRERLSSVAVSDADRAELARAERPVRVAVLTEDDCGDSVLSLPILVSFVESAPGVEMRIFMRSQSPELNQHYIDRGITSIPAVSFMDADLDEFGVWVERSQAANAQLGRLREAHAAKHASLPDEEIKAAWKRAAVDRQQEMAQWYADGGQQATVDEFKAILASAAVDQAGG